MAHGNGKPEKTNPFAYWPVLLIGVFLVAYIFVSGLMRGSYSAKTTDLVKEAEPVEKEAVNVQALAEPTKELIAIGRQKFQVNCASCHGAEGLGDGDKGKSLNPPPRNFHDADGWTNGKSVLDMWHTLEKGVPGTSMSSYQLLPAEDRMAMIHYVSQWVPDQPEMTPEMIAELPGGNSGGGGGTIQPVQTADSGNRIPIELAMRQLVQPPAPRVESVSAHAAESKSAGAEIFAANCASCHGVHGEGGKAVEVLTTAPFVRLDAPAIAGSDASWTENAQEFEEIVTNAEPGNVWHGFGTLSDEDIEMLHDFCRKMTDGSW
ncbi:c-type cytochrome [bacterium]|nr:c-type cytochrome [bacterium]